MLVGLYVHCKAILEGRMVIWAAGAAPGMGKWEMRWETRHANAVKDYERKKADGKLHMVDLTEKLDNIS